MDYRQLLSNDLILQSVHDAIIVTDLQSRILVWNQAAVNIYGRSQHDVLGKNINQVIPVVHYLDSTTDNNVQAKAIVTQQDFWSGRVIQQHQAGHELIIDSAVRQVRDADDTLIALVAINRDITLREQAEETRLRLAAIVEASWEAIFSRTVDGMITSWNPAAERLYGYAADEILGQSIMRLIAPHLHDEVDRINHKVCNGESIPHLETLHLHKDGHSIDVELSISPILDAHNQVHAAAIIVHDITARKQVEANLRHHAFYDHLTDLPNRALFLNRLEHALARLNRNALNSCAVLFLDLDQFKLINDSLGHRAGDQLLIAMTRRLVTIMRSCDTLARFGGDEFAILLEDNHDIAHTLQVADRLHALMAEPVLVEGRHMMVSASIGITLVGSGNEHPEDIIRNADVAMYQAKIQGVGKSAVFDPSMHAYAIARQELEHDLRQALDRNEFVVHYQPIFDLTSGEIASVEALVRWQHPLHGLRLPAEFIPLCEETGLVLRLGELVLQTACAQMVIWQRDAVAPRYVSVNLGRQQLRQRDLPSMISRILQQTGLDPQHLAIELSEANAQDNPATIPLLLEQIRALGIRAVVLDDVGIGYSSPSYVQTLAVTEIKIDLGLVRDMTNNPNHAALVRTLIAMAHGLKLRAIAEGVETEKQREMLKQAGCDAFQGKLMGSAAPADALHALLQPNRPSHPTTPAPQPRRRRSRHTSRLSGL